MAYGYSRGSRGYEPAPRDIVEEEARAAGMSVQQWLNHAMEDGEADHVRHRRGARSRRSGRNDESPLEAVTRRLERRGFRGGDNGRRDEPLSEDRVARILEDAMESIQETISINEERTASALTALSRQLNAEADAPAGDTNRVRSLITQIENTMGGRSAPASQSDTSLVRQLEDKISNVVNLIEERARPKAGQNDEAASLARRRDLRRNTVQDRSETALQQETLRVLRGLDQKLSGLTQSRGGDALAISRSIAEPLQHLKQEIARLGTAVPDSGRSDIILAALRILEQKIDHIPQAAPAGNNFERLFAEIGALRANLQASHAAPDTSAVERQIHALGDRLDAIGDKVAALRMSGPRDLRARQPITGALEELKDLIRNSTAPADDSRVLNAVQALEKRLAAIEQTPSRMEAGFNRFDTIERKLDALQHAPAPIPAGLERFDTIERKLDAMQNAPAQLAARLDRFDVLEEKLDALRRMPPSIPAGLERIDYIEQKLDAIQRAPAELAARLDTIQSLVAERGNAGSAPAALSPNLEVLLRNLTLRLESIQEQPADDLAFERLHAEIQALSKKLESSPAAQQIAGVADVSGLEQSISGLFREIDGLKSELSSAAEQAARRAATDVLNDTPLRIADIAPIAEDTEVHRTLSDIHQAQKEAERRTTQTLGAVHETLQKVVDRLVDMEKDMKQQAEMPVFAPQPAAPSFAQQPLPAPPIAPEPMPLPMAPQPIPLAIRPPQPPFMATPLPPIGAEYQEQTSPPSVGSGMDRGPVDPVAPARDSAFQETIAGIRASRHGVGELVAAPPPPKTGLAAALAAARGAVSNLKPGKAKTSIVENDKPVEAALTEPMPAPAPAPRREAPVLGDPQDLLLEPGSGRPGPGSPPAAAQPNDPKANFLAAARRAAQVATDQTGEALAAEQPAGGRIGPSVKAKSGLKKKHVLLLGLAALIVAVGATLQFVHMPSLLTPSQVESPAPKASGALPNALNPVAKAPIQRPERTAQAPDTSSPRQILPPAADPIPQKLTAARADDRLMSQPPRAAQGSAAFMPPDPTTVGSIAPKAPAAPPAVAPAPATAPKAAIPASGDPLFRFEGIKDAERLKEAARNGDPSAFIELGNRYLEGKGAPRDPRTAALWFERASDYGSAPAQYRLGAMYREGRGVERDAKIALRHFQSAAEAGNARGMHNTAVLLAEGVNGSPDYAGAAEWFKKAAELGIKDSQFNLAILYARGLGTSQDLMASYAWFAAAAATGDEDATKKRDEVGARLSAERLQQAKTAAAAWKPKTADPSANEVSVPPGGWDQTASTKAPAPKTVPKPARG